MKNARKRRISAGKLTRAVLLAALCALAGLSGCRQPAPETRSATAAPSRVAKSFATQPRPATPGAAAISAYILDATLDPGTHSLRAAAILLLRARTDAEQISLLLSPEFRVTALRVNDRPAAYAHAGDRLVIAVPLLRGQGAAVAIRYRRQSRAALLNGGDLIDPRGVYLRPESRWYPSTGELDFQAPLQLAVRVPRGYIPVCAGALAGREFALDSVTYHWRCCEPVRMICLAAGKYTEHQLRAGSTLLTVYLSAGLQQRADAFLSETARVLRFYGEQFGAYPYARLALAEVPVFPGGYGSSSLLLMPEACFQTREMPTAFLAHEVAHQWWGNRVAPGGPGAGWLSEAFAEYSALLYLESRGGAAARQRLLAEWTERYQRGRVLSAEPAIAETDPYRQNGAYAAAIYDKGAYVLHALRAAVGDRVFRRILRVFAARYGGRQATVADFERVASTVSEQPLGWFFSQWLHRRGIPRVCYAVRVRDGRGMLAARQEEAYYRGRMTVRVTDAAGATRYSLNWQGPEARLAFPVRGRNAVVALDPERDWLMEPPRRVARLEDE